MFTVLLLLACSLSWSSKPPPVYNGFMFEFGAEVFTRFRRKSDLARDQCSSLWLLVVVIDSLLRAISVFFATAQPCISVPRNSNCTVAFEGLKLLKAFLKAFEQLGSDFLCRILPCFLKK